MNKQMEQVEHPELMNALVLAYMGDAIYEVYVRQHLICLGQCKPQLLHQHATHYVSAKAQAALLHQLMPSLSDEEIQIVKRGRNAKSGTVPKNTPVTVYRHSTAFEALIGYLYLTENSERLQQIIDQALYIVEHGVEES